MSETRILLLEDDDYDAELIEERLRADGVVATLQRARSEQEFVAALDRGGVDIVLSDFSLPAFDGLRALERANEIAPQLPFVFVSGAIGEERAIETLQRGASDYVLKDRLERLAPAIRRALDLKEERARRRRAEAERDALLVSERNAREAAEAANRMKDEFLALVSHELRTPLNAILGWAQLLVSGSVDQKAYANGLATIERNARTQARLIEDVLDISRVVTGKLQLRLAAVDMKAVVEAAVAAVEPAAKAKKITIAVDVGRAGTLHGDFERLQQVVWNLVANAVKFTPAGGTVLVSATREATTLVVDVADTGQGIASEFLPHVFDRFRQADTSSTRRHGGLGLGLAITRHLVELHGGTISAHSAGAGQGSQFRVHLPAGEAEDATGISSIPPSVAPGFPVDAGRLRGSRVLVVEDEADTRNLVALILESNGAEVSAKASVPEALRELSVFQPTVIVSDIAMPSMDGYSFIRAVRALPADAGGATPALALTAFARDVDRAEAQRAGFQQHLAKPLSPVALVDAVADLTSLAPSVGSRLS